MNKVQEKLKLLMLGFALPIIAVLTIAQAGQHMRPRFLTVLEDALIDGMRVASGAGETTILGTNAGISITTGVENTLIGDDAGSGITEGQENVCVGDDAGRALTLGSGNIFIGHGAGVNAIISSNNVAVGRVSGLNLVGGLNTLIGSGAGSALTSANGNVLLGNDAGAQLTTEDDQLAIDNTDTLNPLIQGNFATRSVTINGDFSTTGDDLNFTNAIVGTELGGVWNIGDGGIANYSTFDSTGRLTMTGTARIAKHHKIFVDRATLGGTAPSVSIVGNYAVLQYSNSGPTEVAYVTWHMPEDWDESTDIQIHAHWAPTTTGTGFVKWDFTYSAVASDVGEVISGAGTLISSTDETLAALADALHESPDTTVPSANISHEDTIGIEISRDNGVGSNYAADASLIYLEIAYIAHSLGESL